MSNYTEQVVALVTKEQKEMLIKLTARHGCSQMELIRRLIEAEARAFGMNKNEK